MWGECQMTEFRYVSEEASQRQTKPRGLETVENICEGGQIPPGTFTIIDVEPKHSLHQ